MRIATELTIKLTREVNEAKEPISEVIVHGASTGKFVFGAVLEVAIRWKNRYLLFVTDDVPFEEMLRILLLNDQLDIIDSARIGWIYATGSFSFLEMNEPNIVLFEFIGGTTWSVELLSRHRFRIPFISEPFCVWRRFGFSRYFIVRGNPHSEECGK